MAEDVVAQLQNRELALLRKHRHAPDGVGHPEIDDMHLFFAARVEIERLRANCDKVDIENCRLIQELNEARASLSRAEEALKQISQFSGSTLREYENAVNVIRDMQYVARVALGYVLPSDV